MAVGDIFTLFKNQTDNLLREIKKGVKEEGLKKTKETAFNQLPTPQKIENDFTTLIDKPKEAEQYYTKTKNKLEAILFKVENARNKLGRLEEKLTKIDKKVNDLNDGIISLYSLNEDGKVVMLSSESHKKAQF